MALAVLVIEEDDEGQAVLRLPDGLREQLDLHAGDAVQVSGGKGEMHVRPAAAKAEQAVDAIRRTKERYRRVLDDLGSE